MNMEHVVKLKVRENHSLIFSIVKSNVVTHKGRKFQLFPKSHKIVSNDLDSGKFTSEKFSY